MGRALGGLGRVVGWGLLIVLLVPVVALVPAMVVDRSWDGRARVSAFPAALVVLDPLVWRCVRNSVLVALAVTIGGLGVGTGLGVLLGRRRFWGRWSLGTLVLLPLAVSPIWVAPGVVQWIGGESSWDWLAARSFLGQPGDDWARWLALVWVGLAGSTPLVILAVRAGLDRVDPLWADAARVVGAGRRRVWFDVTWPTLRPELARAAGTIFTLTLVEPAGPMILGLRRTLAVELADAACRFAEPNRAATLGAIAIGITCLAWSLCARWAGPSFDPPEGRSDPTPAPRAGTRLGALAVVVLLAWVAITLGPVVTCGRSLVEAGRGGHPWSWATLGLVVDASLPPEVQSWAINAAITSSLAVGGAVVLWIVGAGGPGGGWNAAGWVARRLAAVPPLAIGVGALAVPSLVATGADATHWAALADALRAIRTELSPGRSPGWLLILVLAATRWPALVRATPSAVDPTPASPIDAALLAGASPRAARRLARSPSGGISVRAVLAAGTWASTDLGAAWVLTLLSERRTLAPAALHLMRTGLEPLDPRLLGLFVVLTGVRLVGLLLVVGRDRSGRGGRWLGAV